MAPPTFAVVALAAVQIGIAAVLRPLGERLLTRPHWTTVIAAMNRYAFALFLFHATGMAIARSLAVLVLDGDLEDGVPPSLGWWLARPVAVLGAAACTLPLIWLYTRVRPSRVDSARHRRPELAPRLAPLPIPAQRTSAETERGRPVTVVAGGERTQNPG
jgi:hypothetical protein